MNDDELEAMLTQDRPRADRALLVGSIVAGAVCLLSTVWMSHLLAPGDTSSAVEITPLLLALLAVFAASLGGCIAMGYAAARRKPPSD